MTDVLARRDDALNVEDVVALINDRVSGGVVGTTTDFNTFTAHVALDRWVEVATVCRDERALAFDLFDCLFGVDAREEGFDVIAVLYSTSTGVRLALRTRCEGGREQPRCPSLADVYRGANWMERETWDMFGIEFDGHPGLAPRLLTVENFEGWPLRKDFMLTSRVAKPWPGVKEPVELDEDGNVIERVTGIGDAPGPYDLDKAMAEQAKAVNDASAAIEGTDSAVDDGAVTGDDDAAGTDRGEDPVAEPDPQAEQAAQAKADERRRAQAEARRRRAGGGQDGEASSSGTDEPAAADDKDDA